LSNCTLRTLNDPTRRLYALEVVAAVAAVAGVVDTDAATPAVEAAAARVAIADTSLLLAMCRSSSRLARTCATLVGQDLRECRRAGLRP
jgi:hypothetical protein